MTANLLSRLEGLHEQLANDIPQIKRGMVWCCTCGQSQQVNGADCLRRGWPKCCGYTMTIDSPDEIAILTALEASDGTE